MWIDYEIETTVLRAMEGARGGQCLHLTHRIPNWKSLGIALGPEGRGFRVLRHQNANWDSQGATRLSAFVCLGSLEGT